MYPSTSIQCSICITRVHLLKKMTFDNACKDSEIYFCKVPKCLSSISSIMNNSENIALDKV